MKLFFTFFILIQISKCVTAQDSVQVILCATSGSYCFPGYPNQGKTVQHIDSSGNIISTDFYSWQGCDPEYEDTAFMHQYEYLYLFDSLNQLLVQVYNLYNGDTVYINQSTSNYIYDTAGNTIVSHEQNTFPSTQDISYDSSGYNSNNDRIYKLSKKWNWTLMQLDTTDVQEWSFDTLSRVAYYSLNKYTNFTLDYIYHEYNTYDSLSNLTSRIYSDNPSGTFDSTQLLYNYDTLNLLTEFKEQHWESSTLSWQNYSRVTYQYDSLSRLSSTFNFDCSDSLCTDSAWSNIYIYDSTGNYVMREHYIYENDEWVNTGSDHTAHDSAGYLTSEGWYSINFEGCDDGWYKDYYYGQDHHLLHTYEHDVGGCNYTETVCDYYTLNSDSMLLMLNSPATYCPYDTVYMQVTVEGGTPPYSYQWSPAINLLDSTVESPGMVTDTTTVYTLIVTDSLGNVHSVSDTLFVYPKNIRSVTLVSNGAPCGGSQVEITFNADSLVNPWAFQWYRNGFQFSSANDTLFASIDGDYQVLITDVQHGCELMSDIISLEFFPQPVVTVFAQGNTKICPGDSVELRSDPFPTVIWNTGDSTLTILADSAGDYFTTVIDSNGCTGTSNSIQVVVLAPPAVNLGNDTVLCINQSIVLDGGSGFQSFLWQDSSSNQTFLASSAVPDTILYALLVTDTSGCENSDSIIVTFDACASVQSIIDQMGFLIYPNPSSGIVYLEFEKSSIKIREILVLDLTGHEVYQSKAQDGNFRLDLSFLAKGIYQLHFTSGDGLPENHIIIIH